MENDKDVPFVQSGPGPTDSVDLLNYRHVLGWNQAIDVAVGHVRAQHGVLYGTSIEPGHLLDQLAKNLEALRAYLPSPPEAVGPVVAWKFRMDGVDQVMLDEDADIHIRRNGTPLYERPSTRLDE